MMPPKEHIPSGYAVLPYYLTGAISFVVVAVLCLLSVTSFTGHYFQPKILAITHLAVLGWATMIIFGACNQLAPVIAEVQLYSKRLPVAVFFLLLPGAALLVISFWNFSFDCMMFSGGCLVLSSFILHACNLFATMKKSHQNIIADFIVTAHVWLIIVAIIGLMLLINFRHPFLPEEHLYYLRLHASIGMAGWFIQLVVGVSARLIPMFLLSTMELKKNLNVSFYTINAALTLFLVEGMVFKTINGRFLYVSLFLIGLFYYVIYLRKCYRTAMRRQTDHGMKQSLLGVILLSLPFLLLLIIMFLTNHIPARMFTALGFTFFFGFISVMIMGQTFKTLPFIVWMHITKPDKVPEILPKDLFKESWVRRQMYIYLPGFLLFLTGIMIDYTILLFLGSGLMIIAAILYCIHVCSIILKINQ